MLADQTARSARPRPGWSRCTAPTSTNSRHRALATAQVWSALPLSAMVTRAVNGNCSRRKRTAAGRWGRDRVPRFDRHDDLHLRRRELAISHGTSGIGDDVKWLHAAQLRLA